MRTRGIVKLSLALLVWVGLNPAWAGGEAGVLVETAAVEQRSLARTVHAYGVVEPDADHVRVISLPHAGLVEQVWVRPGQRVLKGDKLFSLIDAPENRMQYAQAKGRVAYFESEVQRQRRLMRSKLTTGAQLAAAEKSLSEARTELKTLRDLGQGAPSQVFHAGAQGIVTRVDVQQGQRVMPGTGALVLASGDRLVARLGVEPGDIPDVSAGALVTLAFVFEPGRWLSTRVRDVHAMINPATQLVDVLVPLTPEQSGGVVLGTRVEGTLQGPGHTGMSVADSAVLHDEKGDYVFTVEQSRAKRTEVRVGVRGNGWVEVSGDLNIGAEVVVLGNHELEDGMPVRRGAK